MFTQAQAGKDWARLERYCQQHPHSAYAQYLWGIGAQMANQPLRSLAAFDQAVKLQPGLVDAHYNLACLQETLGHFKPAREHYLATLKLQPDATDALNGLKRVEAQQQKVAAETAAKVAKTLERTLEEVEQAKLGNPFVTGTINTGAVNNGVSKPINANKPTEPNLPPEVPLSTGRTNALPLKMPTGAIAPQANTSLGLPTAYPPLSGALNQPTIDLVLTPAKQVDAVSIPEYKTEDKHQPDKP